MPLNVNQKRKKRGNKGAFDKSFLRFVKLIFWLSFLSFLVYSFLPKKQTETEIVEQNIQEAVLDETKKEETVVIEKNQNELISEIGGILDSYPAVTSSVVFGKVTDENLTQVGEEGVFTGASTTKVLAATCLLQKVETSKITLNTPLGNGTVKSQIQQMINRSNNESWESIMNYLGYGNYQSCARNTLGANSFNPYNNTVKAIDLANVLKGLYNRKYLSEANTSLLLSYMQDTNNENLIPAVLGTENVYHKYGNLEGLLHDTAIIEDGENKYILVVLTDRDNVPNYDQQTALIHEVTKKVSEYYK